MLLQKITALAVLLLVQLAWAQRPTNKPQLQPQQPTVNVPYYTFKAIGTTTFPASVVNANENATTFSISTVDDYGRTWHSTLIAGPSTYSISITLDQELNIGVATSTQNCAALPDLAVCQEYASHWTHFVTITTWPASRIQSAPLVVTAGAEKLTNLPAVGTGTAETAMRTVSSVPKTPTERNATTAQRPTLTMPFYTFGDIEPTLSASIIEINQNATTMLLNFETIIAGPNTYSINATVPVLGFSYAQECTTMTSSTVECEDQSTAPSLTAAGGAIFPPEAIQTALVAVTGGAEKLDQQRDVPKTVAASTTTASSSSAGAAATKVAGKEMGLAVAVGMVAALA